MLYNRALNNITHERALRLVYQNKILPLSEPKNWNYETNFVNFESYSIISVLRLASLGGKL